MVGQRGRNCFARKEEMFILLLGYLCPPAVSVLFRNSRAGLKRAGPPGSRQFHQGKTNLKCDLERFLPAFTFAETCCSLVFFFLLHFLFSPPFPPSRSPSSIKNEQTEAFNGEFCRDRVPESATHCATRPSSVLRKNSYFEHWRH